MPAKRTAAVKPKRAPRKKPAKPKDHLALIRKVVDDAIFETSVPEAIALLRQIIGAVQPMTPYTADAAQAFLDRLSMGDTHEAIEASPDMPGRWAVHKWRREYPDFAHAYARARVDQMHAWADQIITLADTSEKDEDRVMIARAELKIKTRQWLMARFAPDDFGDKSTVNVNHAFENKDDDELRAEFRMAAERAGLTEEEMVAWMSARVQ